MGLATPAAAATSPDSGRGEEGSRAQAETAQGGDRAVQKRSRECRPLVEKALASAGAAVTEDATAARSAAEQRCLRLLAAGAAPKDVAPHALVPGGPAAVETRIAPGCDQAERVPVQAERGRGDVGPLCVWNEPQRDKGTKKAGQGRRGAPAAASGGRLSWSAPAAGLGTTIAPRTQTAADGSITGTVTSAATGVPLGSICVDATEETEGYGSWDLTAEDGTYTLSALPAGQYTVSFQDCSGGDYVGEFYQDVRVYEERTLVVVTAGEVTSGVDAALEQAGAISGTVTSAQSGAPIEGICVYAHQDSGWYAMSATTAADGSYTVSSLEPGEHTVRFHDCNGLGYVAEYFDNVRSYDERTLVPVAVGQTATGIDASLDEAGKISGTVTAASSGAPLAGICVDAYDESGWYLEYAQSAADGTYTIFGLVPGTHSVRFSDCETGTYVSEYYDNTRDWSQRMPIPVSAGETAAGIDASLDLAGKISGTVTGTDTNLPVGGICVWAEEESGDTSGFAETAADGTFTIGGLAAGSHSVGFYDCRDGDGDIYVDEYYNNTLVWAERALVVVASGETTSGIDASLDRAGRISGTVTAGDTGQPLEGVCIWAYGEHWFGGEATTAADGTYTVTGLAPGSNYVEFYDCGDGSYLGEYYNGTRNWEERASVAVVSAQTTPGIDASLDRAGQITGTVTAADSGLPLVDVCVWAYGSGDSWWQYGFGYTAADGSYTVGSLDSGQYTVEFADCGSDTYAPEYYDGVRVWTSATPVAVALGQVTPGIHASLEPYSVGAGSITGRVLDPASAPLEGSYVQTCASDGRCVGDLSAADGTYELQGLIDGEYTVRAWAPSTRDDLRGASVQANVAGTTPAEAPDLVLTAVQPPPTGTTVGTTPPGDVPVVIVGQPFDLTTTEPPCDSGTVTYTITSSTGEVKTGELTENPPGTFSGDIIVPFTGDATVEISQEGCPSTVTFNIYIDPSGYVRTPEGAAISGATVTLYRSDSAEGPFTVVPDGDAIMAPSNRTNPDLTDAEGHFGWDVVGGYYMVRAEKSGCTAPGNPEQSYVESPVYEIPPAVTDVDLRLDCSAAAQGLSFVPVAPCAVFDTRNATGDLAGPLASTQTRTFQVTGAVPAAQGGSECAAPPVDAVAVEINLVALDASRAGNLQLARHGVVPDGGVVNFTAGVSNSNAVSVEVDEAGRVDVVAKGASVQVRGVVLGYYTESPGLRFVPVAPCAVFDTRNATGDFAGPLASTETRTFQVTGAVPAGQGGAECSAPPIDAVGVEINLVALDASRAGNLQLARHGVVPDGGVVNFTTGVSNSNGVSVEVDEAGRVDVVAKSASVQVRGVVLGYYTDGPGLTFVPVAPCAVFDTRAGTGDFAGPLAASQTRTFQVTGEVPAAQGAADCPAPPTDAVGVQINLVALDGAKAGNLQLARHGVVPDGGVVNFTAGVSNSNAVSVEVDEAGLVDVVAKSSAVQVRGVVLGYYVGSVS